MFMFASSHVINALRVIWTVLTLWYELGVFFYSARNCHWPDLSLDLTHGHRGSPSHVLLVADPQILDHRSYPERGPYLTYLTQLAVDLNIRKNWRVALHKRPDAVVFLGDMMDGGRFNMPDDEYEHYYERFQDIFRLPTNTPAYFIPGNHDIGLRTSTSFSPHARARYTSHFGPLNSRISIANHTLVFLNAPGLVEEDSERLNHAKSYKDWTPSQGGSVEFVKSLVAERGTDPIILMSHIPLARDNFDCGPLREKGTIRPGVGSGYQNTLGNEATAFLLEELRPSIIFSGDDHDYCEQLHPSVIPGIVSPTREVSVKSLSMAMGIRRPGFQLLSLARQEQSDGGLGSRATHADVPCFLPDQMKIYLSIYVPLLIFSLLAVVILNGLRVRASSLHARRHSRRSSSPSLHLNLRPRHEDDLSEEEYGSDNSSYLLPRPASAPSAKTLTNRHGRCSCSFVLLGKRRRISGRRKHDSFLVGTLRDARDVATFPLTLFLVISLWISFS
ncbi:Cell division control protein 1 [Hypsizygus marmoreus]|uniref:Cell division control protein 1 n=1 Tax=Hypsizygus marmoreus TaxID=39966 RepID=A0A369JVI7_HYPMA|nr:Cell division control protein 1 [Hypsizygus marmoreus]